jgi:hypothetical protein
MKQVGLGKRQGFTNEASQALAQGVEPALDMGGLPAVFTKRLMPVRVKNVLVSVPEIAERLTAHIHGRDASPQLETARCAAVPNEVGHYLTCAAAQGDPNPVGVT